MCFEPCRGSSQAPAECAFGGEYEDASSLFLMASPPDKALDVVSEMPSSPVQDGGAETDGVGETARRDAAEPTSPFLRACHGLPADRTPVWLLRQAGRYMPEYRALRERHAMLEVIRTPELAAQVTLMPVDAFGVDAAIVFSDILPPLVGMGLDLDFVKGDGPKIGNPISSPRDVDLLGTPPAEETMSGTLGAIALVRRELEIARHPGDRVRRRALHARRATRSRAARRRTSRGRRPSCSPSPRRGDGC